MIPGYNHNIKYKDRIFHVQTEDSGVANPHIITHLFVGGNIIVSLKTSYADSVQSAHLDELVVDLMQGQHKTVLKDLVHGRYDAEIAQRSKNAATLDGPAPLNVEAGAQHRSSFGGGSGEIKVPTPAAATAKPMSAPVPPPRPAGAPASVFSAPPPAAVSMQAPPPAAQEKPSSGKVIEAEALEAAFQSKDDKAVDSIFGNLISEKSLDEVILSYLADDKPRG